MKEAVCVIYGIILKCSKFELIQSTLRSNGKSLNQIFYPITNEN